MVCSCRQTCLTCSCSCRRARSMCACGSDVVDIQAGTVGDCRWRCWACLARSGPRPTPSCALMSADSDHQTANTHGVTISMKHNTRLRVNTCHCLHKIFLRLVICETMSQIDLYKRPFQQFHWYRPLHTYKTYKNNNVWTVENHSDIHAGLFALKWCQSASRSSIALHYFAIRNTQKI